MILALDPGETTGWALLGPDGFPKILSPHGSPLGQVRGQEPLWALLKAVETPPSVVIYEQFRVLGEYKIHYGKELETVQNIGIIKAYAYDLKANGHDVKLVKQENTRKAQGYAWGRIKKQSNHNLSHQWDAMAHATYYAVINKIRPLRLHSED